MACRLVEVLRDLDPDQTLPHDLLRGRDRCERETD
jgi:hypothetical protein